MDAATPNGKFSSQCSNESIKGCLYVTARCSEGAPITETRTSGRVATCICAFVPGNLPKQRIEAIQDSLCSESTMLPFFTSTQSIQKLRCRHNTLPECISSLVFAQPQHNQHELLRQPWFQAGCQQPPGCAQGPRSASGEWIGIRFLRDRRCVPVVCACRCAPWNPVCVLDACLECEVG